MAEREKKFSDNEKLEISEVARNVAEVGEECVWTLVRAKVELMKMALKAAGSGSLTINGRPYTWQEMMHEVDVIDEVINQSRLILQFEGRDSLSELDRHSIEAGMGSVFDPESEISKKIRPTGFS